MSVGNGVRVTPEFHEGPRAWRFFTPTRRNGGAVAATFCPLGHLLQTFHADDPWVGSAAVAAAASESQGLSATVVVCRGSVSPEQITER